KVSGTNTWVSASRIEDIAKQQLGTSLFIVSTGDMEEQIGELPGVTSATVHKDFPDGVNIDVNAQRPAAVLKDAKGALTAVDKEARVLNAVGASVDGIPIIEVSSVGKGTDDAAVKQALKVLAVLPESMRKQITKVSASTQDSITTEISNGQYVIVWGDSSQIALKKAVVDKIINDPTKIGDKHQVDVSAPLRPIIN
ncbi:MAG: FtsQ-type POTRA domain-containing protein, partial [Bifidobacterium crudilactis]|nr:FtsQ-type POTRA domain-containing protein [Bifidobacterium crudilactis]